MFFLAALVVNILPQPGKILEHDSMVGLEGNNLGGACGHIKAVTPLPAIPHIKEKPLMKACKADIACS